MDKTLLDQFSVPTVETSMKDALDKVKATSVLSTEKKADFEKELAAFQEVAVNRFADIDKQELFGAVTDVTGHVTKDNEASYAEASKTMKSFVRKHASADNVGQS